MKKIIIYSLIILTVACNQVNTNSTDNNTLKETETPQLKKKEDKKETRTDEEIIHHIKEEFGIINNNIKSYKKVTKDLMDESSEGGNLEGYFDNKELKKIIISYYGEMGKLIEEYYFWDNNLFFVFTQDYLYDMPMYMEDSKVVKTDENRYYFYNDKLIRWLDPKKQKISNSNLNKKGEEIIKKTEKWKKQFEDTKNNLSDTQKKEITTNTLASSDKKNSSHTAKLLQGKWQYTNDKTNFLIFEDDHRKEIVSGNSNWDDEIFILSNKCSNESNIDNNGPEPENDKYISCLKSDLCWYIVEIDDKNLTLSYMGRGNTLSYIKVE